MKVYSHLPGGEININVFADSTVVISHIINKTKFAIRHPAQTLFTRSVPQELSNYKSMSTIKFISKHFVKEISKRPF